MTRCAPATQSEGLRRERVQASRQFSDGTFRNASGLGPELKGNSLPIIGEYFFGNAQRNPPGALPLERPLKVWASAPDSGFRTTWLGHSTVLLELDGYRVLTDPVFGDRASPLSFAGPKRFHPVPATLAQLPPLDLVVLSHDHYDHLCAPTWRALARTQVPIVTALGVGAHLERLGVAAERITELDWHESAQFGGLHVTATPSQHFSGRGLGDRNRTLWASWVIASQRRKVFFSGDTGPSRDFELIGQRHGPFDLVMLEVGAFHESWGNIHLGPAKALEVFQMLGGGTLLPVHWGTFNLAMHAWDEPAETLLALAAHSGSRVITPRLGAAVEPEHVEHALPWWREVKAEPCSLLGGRSSRDSEPA